MTEIRMVDNSPASRRSGEEEPRSRVHKANWTFVASPCRWDCPCSKFEEEPAEPILSFSAGEAKEAETEEAGGVQTSRGPHLVARAMTQVAFDRGWEESRRLEATIVAKETRHLHASRAMPKSHLLTPLRKVARAMGNS